jgi:hypothetical protein
MLPFRAHIVTTKDFVVPPVMDGIKWTVSKNCTFGLVCNDILKSKRTYSYSYRCWVRSHKPATFEIGADPDATEADYVKVDKADAEPAAADAKDIDSQETVLDATMQTDSADVRDDIVPPEGRLPKSRRQLTSDIVEVDGDWRLFRKPDKVPVMDICVDDGGVTELLIEPGPSSYHTHSNEVDWPRAQQALAWQKDLRVGDEVDCLDLKNTWLEAVIIEVIPNKSVRVHFKGWNSTFDETIPIELIPRKIMPLYSNVKNWRANVEEDDKLDVRIELNGQFLWVLGTVQEINVPEKKVLVSYSEADCVAAANPGSKNRSRSSFDDIDDDDKPLSLMDAVNNKNGVDDKKMVPSLPPAIHQEWRDIDGEDVCDAYMHTQRKYNGSFVSRGYDDVYGEKNTTGKPIAKGVVGLQNLGNTCFMNSVLQCMSNTYCVTDFFVSNRYKSQVNINNVLGHKGEVAKVYAKLMKDMWCDGYTKVVPRNFKRTIGEFQPQFAGYSQQDSQEFLGFLLDGLHEDLNRVSRPPYVPKIDSNGRDDILIARESWRRFLLRNDSELVDRVYGQLRSHVTCAFCGKESVTFDAFNTLSLPVPIKTSKIIAVMVRMLPLGSTPLKVNVSVELNDSVGDLRMKVASQLRKAGYLKNYDISKVKRVTSYAVKMDDLASPELSSPAPVIALPNWAADDAGDDMNIDYDNRISSDDARKNVAVARPVAGTPVSQDAEALAAEKAEYARRQAAIDEGSTSLEPVFHMCAQYDHEQFRISKNLDDKTPVGDLLRGRENAYMFQLEHPCSVKSKGDPRKFVSYVDLLFCVLKKLHAALEHLEVFSFPERINVTKDTTPAELYILADKSFGRIVQHSSEYWNNTEKRPYALHVKQLHDAKSKRLLDPNDRQPIIFGEFECLAMQLLPEANLKTHIMTTEISRVEHLTVPAGEDDDTDSGEMDVVGNYGAKKSKGLNVYKCLDKFVEREQLNEAETIYCSKCKNHLAPVKKMDLWATPDVLVIHLKRFQYVPGQYFVHR